MPPRRSATSSPTGPSPSSARPARQPCAATTSPSAGTSPKVGASSTGSVGAIRPPTVRSPSGVPTCSRPRSSPASGARSRPSSRPGRRRGRALGVLPRFATRLEMRRGRCWPAPATPHTPARRSPLTLFRRAGQGAPPASHGQMACCLRVSRAKPASGASVSAARVLRRGEWTVPVPRPRVHSGLSCMHGSLRGPWGPARRGRVEPHLRRPPRTRLPLGHVQSERVQDSRWGAFSEGDFHRCGPIRERSLRGTERIWRPGEFWYGDFSREHAVRNRPWPRPAPRRRPEVGRARPHHRPTHVHRAGLRAAARWNTLLTIG